MDAFFLEYPEDCFVFLYAACSLCSILIQNISLAVYIRVSAYQSITSANDTIGVMRNNSVAALISSIFNISIQLSRNCSLFCFGYISVCI